MTLGSKQLMVYSNRVQFKLKRECCYCCCCRTDGHLVRPLQYKKVINVMRPDFRFLIYIRSIYSPTMMAKRVKTMTTRGREHSVSRIHFSFYLDIYFFNNQNCSNKIDWEERARERDMTLLGRLFNSSQTQIDDTFFADCLREISWNIIKSITQAGVSGE